MIPYQNKKEARSKIKRQFMLDAAYRWNLSSRTGFKMTEAGDSASRDTRQNNHLVRETIRSQTGATIVFDALKRVEEAQINTWDAENIPPHSKAALAGRPVARILDNMEEKQGFGTGFLISPNLFITNCHVFPDLDYAVECAANFGYEYDTLGKLHDGVSFNLEPENFYIKNKELDFAIVAISNLATDKKTKLADLGFVQMIETPGKIIKGDDINIIQYPLGGNKQYACKQNQVLQIFEEEGYVQYITDTAKASSGSPCFNKFWELAALHHCAIPETRGEDIITNDNKVWDGIDEDEVHWIANEGISISKIVAYLKANIGNLETETKNIQFLSQLLGSVKDPLMSESGDKIPIGQPAPLVNTKEDTITDKKNDMGTYTFNFYGPASVNFTDKNAASVATVEAIAKTPAVGGSQTTGLEQDAIKFDEDYDSRENRGYQSSFLAGNDIDVPDVEDSRKDELYEQHGKPYIAKYYNYSLVMNEKRRFCMWTAANVNYNKNVRSTKSRAEFGRDVWRRDPRIPDALQVIGSELYNPAKRVEQGHIVRREDAAWGDSEKEIEYANSDTFHYTNCTPQLEPFNRKSPRASEGYDALHGIWGDLEDEIKKQLKNADNKAVIFAGPYLGTKDPVQDFTDNSRIKYPLKFWKVVCVLDGNGKLFSYGFWLDQTDVVNQFGLGVEALDFKRFKKQQRPIREITKLTKVKFDKKVYDSDILKKNFQEGAENVIPYEDASEIQFFPG